MLYYSCVDFLAISLSMLPTHSTVSGIDMNSILSTVSIISIFSIASLGIVTILSQSSIFFSALSRVLYFIKSFVASLFVNPGRLAKNKLLSLLLLSSDFSDYEFCYCAYYAETDKHYWFWCWDYDV